MVTWMLTAWLLLVSPVISISWAWSRVHRTRTAGLRSLLALVALAIASASCLLIWIGLFQHDVIGRDYSGRRTTTIEVNLALMVAMTLLSAASESRLRVPIMLSCFLTGVVWMYMGVLSVAV